MIYGSILAPAGADYFAIPAGSRIDRRAERLETMRRHRVMGTYPLTMFLADLFAPGEQQVVTADNLVLHLDCVRVAESKDHDEPLSEERILEMVLEAILERRPSGDDLSKLDASVLEALDLRIALTR